jgi:hypothetical protein
MKIVFWEIKNRINREIIKVEWIIKNMHYNNEDAIMIEIWEMGSSMTGITKMKS